tara:strand:- start:44 stop:634 length:591 start_codon:yes stop_codon:yes gene_type:complete
MNYGELKTLVADYMHRADLDSVIPGFVELAHARIMRDLRVAQMIEDITLTVSGNPQALPADFLDMRELSYSNGSNRYTLASVGRGELARFTAATGGLPRVYSLVGGSIEIQPETLGDFRLIYWKSLPFFTSDSETNAVLVDYPYLYLYGALIEANSYIQDVEQRMKSIEFFDTEINLVNAESMVTRYGEAPQIGAL